MPKRGFSSLLLSPRKPLDLSPKLSTLKHLMASLSASVHVYLLLCLAFLVTLEAHLSQLPSLYLYRSLYTHLSGPFYFALSLISRSLSVCLREGETHPKKKTTHPNKNTVCANNFGTVCTNYPPFPFKTSRKGGSEVCANCLCKLFLFGWVVFWVGRRPLMSVCPSVRPSEVGPGTCSIRCVLTCVRVASYLRHADMVASIMTTIVHRLHEGLAKRSGFRIIHLAAQCEIPPPLSRNTLSR